MGGLPGMCVTMTVLIVIQFITGIPTELVMYREGCIVNTSVLVTSVTGKASTHLPNNYPGTCLAYCQREGISVKYIALKATSCLCVQRSYPELGKYINSTRACDVTCPGHTEHLCGGQSDYSLCIVANDSTVQTTSQCLSYQCGVGTSAGIEATDCSTDLHPFCVMISTQDPMCSMGLNNWSQALRQCSAGTLYQDRYYYLKNTKLLCGPRLLVSSSLCKTGHSWIGAFAVWAPPKSCDSKSLGINHGNYTLRYASGDNETIDYSCEGGYKLQGAATWFCMANNSWVSTPWSPHKPACNKTSSPSTSSPATAATSMPTGPTAAPGTTPSTTIVVSGTSTMGNDDKGTSAGVIAAIVIGACIAVALIAVAIGCVIKNLIVGSSNEGKRGQVTPTIGSDDGGQDAVTNTRFVPRKQSNTSNQLPAVVAT